jgi:hypothetical protein
MSDLCGFGRSAHDRLQRWDAFRTVTANPSLRRVLHLAIAERPILAACVDQIDPDVFPSHTVWRRPCKSLNLWLAPDHGSRLPDSLR